MDEDMVRNGVTTGERGEGINEAQTAGRTGSMAMRGRKRIWEGERAAPQGCDFARGIVGGSLVVQRYSLQRYPKQPSLAAIPWATPGASPVFGASRCNGNTWRLRELGSGSEMFASRSGTLSDPSRGG
jgi:hypothetical protein